jgi:16S rRNA processing protein RimM
VPVVLRSLQLHQGRFLIELEGCSNRTAAESWRGAVVHVRQADLAPLGADVHYQRDVIGLRVQTEDGETIGRVERILPSRAHDLYEVRDTQGRSFLLPASKAFVRAIDLEAGVMTVRLVPGLRPD